MCSASPPPAILRAIWGSLPVSDRAGIRDGSARSPSVATPICARFSSTERDRSSRARSRRSMRRAAIACVNGRPQWRRPAATTKPRSLLRTRWLGWCGQSGVTVATTSRPPSPLNLETNSHPGLPRDRVMAEQVGPAHGKPTTMMALVAAVQRLASVRADSVMARSPQGSSERGRRYVCSPSRSARLSIVSTRLDNNVFPRNGAAFGRASPMAPPRGRARAGAPPLHPA